MNEKLKEMREAWKNLYGSLFKWIVLSGVIGSFIGLIASGFSYAIVWATSFRQANPMIILGLPLGGLLIVWLYKITGQEKNSGTNLVLTVVRSDEEEVPGWVTPLILISTAITHLFGGSSGREGAALQFGASVGNVCAKYLHLNESDKKIIILASMSAAFSALFTDGGGCISNGSDQCWCDVLCRAGAMCIFCICRTGDCAASESEDRYSAVFGRIGSGFLQCGFDQSDYSGNCVCACRSTVLYCAA